MKQNIMLRICGLLVMMILTVCGHTAAPSHGESGFLADFWYCGIDPDGYSTPDAPTPGGGADFRYAALGFGGPGYAVYWFVAVTDSRFGVPYVGAYGLYAKEPKPRKARLLFIGDVMSHLAQVTAARSADGEYNFNEVFRHVKPMFDSADLVIANLETTLCTHGPYTGYPQFAAPAELAVAMRMAGIDVAVTANNHICDKGAKGISSTLAILDSVGIAHTGAFADTARMRGLNPLYREAGGLRFAILAYTYGTNGLPVPRNMAVNLIDTARIAADLVAVDSVDCLIVCYHWGEEYQRRPTKEQRELAAWTRASGADIIIGTHPHVIQPVEIYFDEDSASVTGATFYSLGNFVSNQRERYTDGGIIADITAISRNFRPVTFEVCSRLVWVHKPLRDGVNRFEVLPERAADTMAKTPALEQFMLFITDSRQLLDTTYVVR